MVSLKWAVLQWWPGVQPTLYREVQCPHLMGSYVCQYLENIQALLTQLPVYQIENIVDRLAKLYVADQALVLIGNPESHPTIDHVAQDFQRLLTGLTHRTFRCIAFTNNPSRIHTSSQDLRAFSEQVCAWLQPDDVLLAISAAETNPCLVQAVEAANELGVYTIAFCGLRSGRLASMAREAILVPSGDGQYVEQVHMVLLHLLVSAVRDRFVGCQPGV